MLNFCLLFNKRREISKATSVHYSLTMHARWPIKLLVISHLYYNSSLGVLSETSLSLIETLKDLEFGKTCRKYLVRIKVSIIIIFIIYYYYYYFSHSLC